MTYGNGELPNGGWIPVSEKLPEIHQDVLLSLRSLDIQTGFRAKMEPYFYCHGANGYYIEPQNVLAWMPLPQPYKGESEDEEISDRNLKMWEEIYAEEKRRESEE